MPILSRWSVTASTICGQAPLWGRSWPMPFIIMRFAPGMASAVSFPASRGTRGSSSPCIMRVGILTDASAGFRLPCANIAMSWRATPSGQKLRSYLRAARFRIHASSNKKPVPAMVLNSLMVNSMAASRSSGGGVMSICIISGLGCGRSGFPVEL